MPQAVSLGMMVQRLDGLVDTKDLSDWENRFVQDVVRKTAKGKNTSVLSEKEADKVDELHAKHFA